MKKTIKRITAVLVSLSIILATVLSCDYNQSDLFSLRAFAEEPDEYSSESVALSGVACIQSSDIVALAGETISVPFVLENNPGIMGFSFVVEYDKDVFTPLCVNAGDILNGGVIDNSIGGAFSEGKFKVTFSADENFYENGTVFTVDFTINENAEPAVYSLGVSYLQRDTFNENFEDVTLDCSDFNIVITSKEDPDDGMLRFYSENQSVNAGEDIAIPVYADNANGLTDFRLSFSYDNAVLQFKEVKSSDYTVKFTENGNGVLTVECNKLSVNTDSRKFFDIIFKTAEYTESEENILISCGYAFINGDSVDSECVDSVLTIKNPYIDQLSVIYTENRISNNNGYLEIPVFINNNHGIMGFGINISYDKNVLEAVSVAKGNVISKGNFNTDVGSVPGKIKVIWNHMEDIRDNGLLFTLRFRILDEKNLISVPVTFSYSQADTYNEAWEDVPLNVDIGTILLKLVYTAQFIAGGAVVSTREFTVDTEKLIEPSVPPRKGYIACWEEYELKEENLVINAKYIKPSVSLISEYVMKTGNVSKLLPSCNFKPSRKEWSTSNGSVATVDNHGNVTAVGEGKCTVKVICYAVDSCGNEVKVTAGTKIIVEEKVGSDTAKEKFRKAFDEFFEATLHNILENIRMVFLAVLRVHPYIFNQMELTFNPNGGTVSETQLTVYAKKAVGELPVPARKGYTFVGWFTKVDGGTKVTSETVFSTVADVTLYAHWLLNTYTINFNANGGSVDLISKTVNAFDVYGALPVPQREGYTFKGWYTEVNGGTKVNSETVFESNCDVTLYARWSLIYFTVNYDPNGGAVSQSTKIVYYGRPIGGLPTPSRNLYTFDGWYTEAEGGTKVTPSTSFNRVEDITLYAHWTMNNITVYFDANGGTAETESKTVGSDSTYGDLPIPTKKGYDFLGWYTDIENGELISFDTMTNTTIDQILYAHWSLSSFNVNFDSNGGANTVSSVKAYYGTPIGKLPVPTRTYYTFDGWYTDPTEGFEVTPETVFNSTYDITLYAHWTLNTFNVYFDASGGEVSVLSKNVVVSCEYGNLPTPTRTGFSFDGWYTDSIDGKKIYPDTIYTIEADSTLYAHWSPLFYTVTWNDGIGYTASVYRISSEYANASECELAKGDIIYYGDELEVVYKAETGYSITENGVTSIVVRGDITENDILATATANYYDYTVVYKSSNGTDLGSKIVNGQFGTSKTIMPSIKAGYKTPSAKSVKWDATKKTIEFIYVPESVAYTTGSGTLDATPRMDYEFTIEYRNRTSTTVEARLCFKQIIKAGNGYDNFQYRVSLHSATIAKEVVVVPFNTWPNAANYDRSCSASTEWITFTGLSPTSQKIYVGVNQFQRKFNGEHGGYGLQTEFYANIPTY